MEPLVVVGLGGALGSILRYRLSRMPDFQGLPLGTLAVNVSGSFILSLLAFAPLTGDLYNLLGVGLLGGYTTFSSFGFETFRLIEDGDYYSAMANAAKINERPAYKYLIEFFRERDSRDAPSTGGSWASATKKKYAVSTYSGCRRTGR
jgi:CrcB protein